MIESADIPEVMEIEIPERNHLLYFPLSLNRLNEDQFVSFFELFFRLQNKEMDFYDFAVLLTFELLGLKKPSKKSSPAKIERAMSNVARLAEYVQNFFEREENHLRLKLEYSHNHLKEIKIPMGGKLIGPADYFQDSSFGQYEDGLNIFLQYNETPSIGLLRELTATFYTDGKQKLSLEQRKKKLEKVSPGILFGFYHTFAAFHTYFSGSKVYSNGQLIDLSILFKNQSGDDTGFKSQYAELGMKSTAFEIAKSGILGTLPEVRNTKLWEVALLLYDMRKKALDEAARAEQLKKKT